MAYARQEILEEHPSTSEAVIGAAVRRRRQYVVVILLAFVVSVTAGFLYRQTRGLTPAEVQQIRGQEMSQYHQRLWEQETARIQTQRAEDMAAYHEHLWRQEAGVGD